MAPDTDLAPAGSPGSDVHLEFAHLEAGSTVHRASMATGEPEGGGEGSEKTPESKAGGGGLLSDGETAPRPEAEPLFQSRFHGASKGVARPLQCAHLLGDLHLNAVRPRPSATSPSHVPQPRPSATWATGSCHQVTLAASAFAVTGWDRCVASPGGAVPSSVPGRSLSTHGRSLHRI